MDSSPTLQRYVTQVEMTVASMQREIDMARYARDDFHRMRDEVLAREGKAARSSSTSCRPARPCSRSCCRTRATARRCRSTSGPTCRRIRAASRRPRKQYQAFDAILAGNAAWRAGVLAQDPDFFERLSKGQKPDILYVGCADSRVSAELLTGCGLGELFVTPVRVSKFSFCEFL